MKYITPFSIITLLFLTSFLVACQSNTVETNQPTNQVIATPTTQVNTEPIKTDQITQDTQKPTKSINDWLKKESAIKCTFSGTMNNIQKSMSLYYAGKKWRMETQTIQNNQITNYGRSHGGFRLFFKTYYRIVCLYNCFGSSRRFYLGDFICFQVFSRILV